MCCVLELADLEYIGHRFTSAVQFACEFLKPKPMSDSGEIVEVRETKSNVDGFCNSEKRFILKSVEGPLSTSSSLVLEM